MKRLRVGGLTAQGFTGFGAEVLGVEVQCFDWLLVLLLWDS